MHAEKGHKGLILIHDICGFAVGIGMRIAGYISKKIGMLSEQELTEQNALLSLAQLPLELSKDFDVNKFILFLKNDKVNNGTGIRLVLLEKIGKYQLKGQIDEILIKNVIIKHLMLS